MKLLYRGQALASLQGCLDFFPSEVSAEKVNVIRDTILNRADKLVSNPTWASRKNI